MLKGLLAAFLYLAPSAGANGVADASALRQQLVWSLEERLVAATLDELLYGSLVEARSILATVQGHRDMFRELSDADLSRAAALLRSADESRRRLAAAGALKPDSQGRLVFVHFGRAPDDELAQAYQRHIADVVKLTGAPYYRAAAGAAARFSDCRALSGAELGLCRTLNEGRLLAAAHHLRYKRLVDGGGLGDSLSRAISANGAFNSRWGYPE